MDKWIFSRRNQLHLPLFRSELYNADFSCIWLAEGVVFQGMASNQMLTPEALILKKGTVKNLQYGLVLEGYNWVPLSAV